MTKSEKNIISAINTMESNEEVTYLRGALFTDIKGISQNFAFIDDGYISLRVDHNCRGIIRKVLKHYDLIEYKIYLSSDRISKKLINKYHKEDYIEEIPSIFDYFDLQMIKIFIKYNISFKELIFNGVDYFKCHSEFLDIIEDIDDNFWKSVIRSREIYFFPYMMKSKINELEVREFVKSEWLDEFKLRDRNKILENLLKL